MIRQIPTIIGMIAIVVTTSSHAAELYRCEVTEAMEPVKGKLTSNASTDRTIKMYNPIIVDTATGVLRIGADQYPWYWKVKQQGNASMDFIAAHAQGTDSITLRVWEKPVQMIITDGHLTIVVGVCSVLK